MADQSLNIIVKLTDQASQGLRSFSGKIDDVANRLDSATQGAQTFTKVVTAAGVAVAGYAVKTFMDFEKTMSGVKAVLSPTTEEFGALQAKVKQLGADTVFSQGEIARATEELAKNGLDTAQILGGALDATANFASAAGTDLTNAGTIMSDAMNVFKLSANDAAQAVDQMTGVTIASKFGAQDYALALAQGGAMAKTAGLSFTDFNTSIAAISNAFASGSDAGTSFKVFLQNLVPKSAEAAGMMEEIGFNAYDATGKLKSMRDIADNLSQSIAGMSDEQRSNTLTTIFGTDAMRAAAMIAEQGAAGFDKYAASIAKTNSAEQAKTRLDNLSGSMERLKGTIDVMMTNLGEVLGNKLRPAIDGINEGLQHMGDWWNGLSPTMQNAIATIGAVVAALAGLVFIIGAIGLVVTPLMGAFSTIAATFGFLASAASTLASALGAVVAFLGGPLTLIILAVTAVIAALYYAWTNNFMGIQDITKNFVSNVISFFAGLGQSIQSTWNDIKTWTSDAWNSITSGVSSAWETIKSVFTTAAQIILAIELVLLESILNLFGTNLAEVLTIVTGVWDNIKAITSTLAEILKLTFTTLWETTKSVFNTGTTVVKLVFSSFVDLIKNVASVGAEALKLVFGGLWESIKGMFRTGSEAAGVIWGTFASSISSTMTAAWENVKKTIADSINWIINKANAVIRSINAVSDKVGIKMNEIPPLTFQTGGIVPGFATYQTGGIISGGKNPASHDKVPAMLDPGELILNRAQQSNLADQMYASEGKTSQTLVVQVTGNSFYGSDSDFADKVGDAIFSRFNVHQALPGF